MRSIHDWLNEYRESHQNPINKMIHWICVPLIMLSLMGLLWTIPTPLNLISILGVPLNWTLLFILFCIIFYSRLSIKITLGMACVGILLVLGVLWLNTFETALWKISVLIFVPAWLGQFIGHFIEGKRPSFSKDLQFLLIGPAWLISFIFNKLKVKF